MLPRSTRYRTSECCGVRSSVILHDPGWHDQHWLCENIRRGWAILDQFHQFIAENYLTSGSRDIFADPEALVRLRRCHCYGARPVFGKVAHATSEIGACFVERMLDHHRIHPRHIGWREGVEILMDHESDPLSVSGPHSTKRSCCAAPPLLLCKEGLLPPEKRKLLPGLVLEAVINRFWPQQRYCAASHEGGEPRGEHRAQGDKFELPPRSARKMR